MKKLVFVVLGLFFVLQGCQFNAGTTGSWQNDNIAVKEKQQIAILNKKLFKALVANDVAGVKALSSPEMIAKVGKDLDGVVNTISSNLNDTAYTVVDEFYTKNSSEGQSNELMSSRANDNDYIIKYLAINKEMYASLLTTTNTVDNCLITLIYGKYGDDWKINILEEGEYRVFGKTGPEYYKAGVEQYKKGNLIDAVNMINIANQLSNPAGKHIEFNIQKELTEFSTKLVKEVNDKYQFPVTLKQIKTLPKIYTVVPKFVNDKNMQGIFPMVQYQSTINLKDTVALKQENMAMQKSIGSLFKGIDQDKSLIIYQAFNELPDGKHQVMHYGFLQELK